MTAFCDMTRAELEEAIAAELREFMGGIEAPVTLAEVKAQLVRYGSDFGAHFEYVTHPPTEAEKAARLSPRFELRAKTAWGYLEMVRQGYAEVPR